VAEFKLALVADVSDLVRKTDDVGDALEKVGKSLDGVGDVGTASTKKLEREFSEAADKMKADARTTGKAIGDDISSGTREASEGAASFKDNAAANAKEVAASFDGSAQSIANGFQGLAAEALEGFGPAGVAAGVAAAAGIGLIQSALENAKEKAQETAEKVADIADTLIDIGSNDLGADDVNDQLREWATTAEDGSVKLQQLSDTAAAAGIDFRDFARGLAGDTDAANRSMSEIADAQAKYAAAYLAIVNAGGPEMYGKLQGLVEMNEAQTAALGEARRALSDNDDAMGSAADTADLYREVTEGATDAIEAQAEATARAQAAQEQYLNALEDAADPVSTYEDILKRKNTAEHDAAQATADATEDTSDTWETYAHDVNVTIDDLISDMNAKADAASAFEANLGKIAAAGGQAMADELRAKGPEAASAVAQVIADADPAKQAELFAAQAKAAGESIVTNTAAGITDNKGAIASALQGAIDSATADATGNAAALYSATGGMGQGTATQRRTASPATTPPASTGTTTAVVSGPLTVNLSQTDRDLLSSLADRPVQVSVTLDAKQIASQVSAIQAAAYRSRQVSGGTRGVVRV
jgi:hypothetical protein